MTMIAERAPRGEVDLSAQVTIDGRPIDVAGVRPVARSGIYAFDVEPGLIALTLAPLALGDAGRALLGAPRRHPGSGSGRRGVRPRRTFRASPGRSR